jgi:hypothetical protein
VAGRTGEVGGADILRFLDNVKVILAQGKEERKTDSVNLVY